MNVKHFVLLGVLGTSVGCAPLAKSEDMTSYENARQTEAANEAAERFPNVYLQAQVHHAKAVEAQEAKNEEAMNHHAAVAMLWWDAARTNNERVELEESTALLRAETAELEAELAAAEKRQSDATAALARLEKIRQLEGKLGESSATNEARQAINDALAALKQAEAVSARTHASAKMKVADQKLADATSALEAGKLAKAKEHAALAEANAQEATKEARPAFEAEQSSLAKQRRIKGLFDAAGSVSIAERSIVEGGVLVTIRGVFESNKVELDPERYEAFNRLVEIANEYDDFSLVIEGHTDSRGGAQNNLDLSEGRAKAILSYMSQQGVAPQRMTAIGKGEDEPVADNRSRSGRSQNRRIELLFAPAGKTN